MRTDKLHAGADFPALPVRGRDDTVVDIGNPTGDADWQMVVVNADGRLQVVDLSNNPFARPDLEIFVSGLEWIRAPENNYPIRGTYRRLPD